jgi:hypothetical protein
MIRDGLEPGGLVSSERNNTRHYEIVRFVTFVTGCLKYFYTKHVSITVRQTQKKKNVGGGGDKKTHVYITNQSFQNVAKGEQKCV